MNVLSGDGVGGFTAAGTSLAGAGSNGIAAADFDEDGVLDLATADAGSDYVTIHIGDGHGSFSRPAAPAFPTGDGPWHITAADFDGDGDGDLATVNPDSDDVTVLLGDGAGGFTPAPGGPFLVGDFPDCIVAADFDGDGNTDLVTVNRDSDDVTVLLGDGAGGFTLDSPIPFANISGSDAVAGDFDGDGDQDLATASGNVIVLLGDGAGGFTPAAGSPFPGWGAQRIVAADLDGDSDVDLATVSGDYVAVLLGNGAGSFTPAATIELGDVGAWDITAADFDGDGDQDLATAHANRNAVVVHLGDGAGSFVSTAPFPTAREPRSIAAGDFDGDGDQDLATTSELADSVSIFLGDGAGSFARDIAYTVGDMPFALVAADVDGDGFPDLATADYRSDTVSVLRNVSVPPGGVRAEYNLEPNETLSTGSDATSTDPMATMITSPVATTITIVESPVVTTPVPDGFVLLDTQVAIDSDVPSTFDEPFVVVFRLDPALLGGAAPADLRAVRNGDPVELCTGAPDAIPDPCHDGAPFVDPGTGDVVVTILTSDFSIWNFALVVADDGDFLFSVESGETLAGGLRVNNEDVVRYDASEDDFELVFDGSDVGVSDLAIDALALLPDGDLVLSFRPADHAASRRCWAPGSRCPGWWARSRTPTSCASPRPALGTTPEASSRSSSTGPTSGSPTRRKASTPSRSWATTSTCPPAGRSRSTAGVKGRGEDLLVCRGAATGGTTDCDGLEVVFDGSDAGLAGTGETLDAFSFAGDSAEGPFFSTDGRFDAGGAVGNDEDVFACAGDLDTCEGRPRLRSRLRRRRARPRPQRCRSRRNRAAPTGELAPGQVSRSAGGRDPLRIWVPLHLAT